MAELAYWEVYTMNAEGARHHLIRTYQETDNISEAARLWHTSRQVERKWLCRFQQEGGAGLQDRSRHPLAHISQDRPHHSPRQTPAEIEQ